MRRGIQYYTWYTRGNNAVESIQTKSPKIKHDHPQATVTNQQTHTAPTQHNKSNSNDNSTPRAQLVGFTLSDLLDKPWSQFRPFFPPVRAFNFYRA